MIQLDKRAFRNWLTSHQGQIVGNPNSPHRCPIARFLQARGGKDIHVEICERRVDGKIHQHIGWQQDFQVRAQELQKELNVTGLRGREALRALQDVVEFA